MATAVVGGLCCALAPAAAGGPGQSVGPQVPQLGSADAEAQLLRGIPSAALTGAFFTFAHQESPLVTLK